MWKRFACDELEVLNTNSSSLLPCLMVTSCSYSDESDDEIDCEPESFLMSNVGRYQESSIRCRSGNNERDGIVSRSKKLGKKWNLNVIYEKCKLCLGKSIQAAESALTLEKHRLKKLEELEAVNQSLKSCSNEIVSTQDPFAGSYVILYVTSQVQNLKMFSMDIVLADFYKACIYTVPKHIISSHSGWDSDAYHRLASTVRRYGALVQTDICGGNAHNIHGIEHGWAWFARFLNKISAYRCYYNSLKRISPDGRVWSIHQRYKSQFLKAANVVREHFLPKLRAKKDAANLQTIITDITAYLDYQMYVSQGTYRKN
ncbi:BnaC05g09050D [Brassica napus]|uniref:mRNA export factor GLE1 n=3 Tax=Brassica TaxID=3705 RepID=A0A078G236_BRANA|nr:BnaC05g09050D [Brassica napus]VDD42220.1 unnamed protein product [Brassica oleracea]